MEGNTNKQAMFFEGSTLIFKKWSAFRLTLDNNPEILDEYVEELEYDENQEEILEVIHMYNLLLCDIYTHLENGYDMIQTIAELLQSFFEDFFETFLEDDSKDIVAKNLIKLFRELKEGKTEFLDKLREVDKTFNYKIYSIEFPIVDIPVEEEVKIEKLTIQNEPDEDGFVEVGKKKKLR
jgi:hypothetical protein